MSLQGLPDFQHVRTERTLTLYSAYEGGALPVSAAHLVIASQRTGQTDLLLEAVRGSSAMLPPAPYGTLDLRVEPADVTDAALAMARDERADAQIRPATLAGGWLHLRSPELLNGLHAYAAPAELSWNGLGVARSVFWLDEQTTRELRGLLHGAILPLSLTAEAVLEGVAPRWDGSVTFDPARVGAALPGASVRHDAIVTWALGLPDALSFSRPPTDDERPLLAATLADRIVARWGRFVASSGELTPTVVFDQPFDAGRVEWNLSEAVAVRRVIYLRLDALAAMQQLASAHGPESLFRERVVPALQTGFVPVRVSANLPDVRVGVEQLGVKLAAPANPPLRFQAVAANVELLPPTDTAETVLRFSPAETPTFTATPVVYLRENGRLQAHEGTPISATGRHVALAPDTFPVRFVPIRADGALLALAELDVTCAWEGGTVACRLNDQTPAAALAMPRTATATLTVVANPHTGTPQTLGPMPARPLALGLFSFPAYGPHAIDVRATFPAGVELLAVELAPEDGPTTTLALTPAQPAKPWRWLARSPFLAGYRYRVQHPDQQFGPWSALQMGDAPLVLNASERIPPMQSTTETILVAGLACTPHPDDPLVYRYVPLTPGPQRSSSGDVALTVISTEGFAMLQLGTQWAASDATLTTAQTQIAAQRGLPDASSIRLTPDLLRVERAVLWLHTAAGSTTELATSTTSQMPPYSAVFNVRLDAEQQARVLSALGGSRDTLGVTYHTDTISATTDVADWFTGNGGLAHVQRI